MIDDQQWKLKADQCLSQLYQSLAAASDEHDFEADYADALTVEFDEPRAKFVVSPNAPVQQIWVSAHSRSFKLDYDSAQDDFVLGESGQTLKQLMAAAISKQLGENVDL